MSELNHIFLSRRMWAAWCCALALALLNGCEVGPDFRRPDAPEVDNYTGAPLSKQTTGTPEAGVSGAAQRLNAGQNIPDEWWTLFHSKALDTLIRQALQDSPTIASAQATLRQAQENMRAEYGVLYPSVDAKAGVSRQRTAGAASGIPGVQDNTFNLYNASVNVSYEFDVVGGARRELEALKAGIEYQQFELEAAHLTLTSNIVTTAVQEASLRAQLAATQDILAAQEKQFEIVNRQYQLGAVAGTDLIAQQTQVAQTRALVPPLQKQIAQTRNQLAVYAGRLPGDPEIPEFDLDDLQLPQDLPVSLPSDLVRQRPDIRASEALLHQASAKVGVATAAMYPQLTLSASLGKTDNSLAGALGADPIWSLGANLVQPIFHGGTLSAQRAEAVAAYDQAGAQYRETVLLAFQNVADVLRALEFDADTLKAQSDTARSAHDGLDLAQKQFDLGAVSYLTLLNAQRQYQQATIDLAQARATRYADTAALFTALGGGWWNRDDNDNAEAGVTAENQNAGSTMAGSPADASQAGVADKH